jgi:glutathione-regulated potassium-efflux system ancillary protein KefC/glutathione-regulated potassium-efflux system protein KefB
MGTSQSIFISQLYFAPVEHSQLLLQAAVYFAAAVLAVMLSHRLGLGSVAGYLLAGIAIGPWGFKLVGQTEDVRAFAELGVVFLLFVIGLELEPQRLWSMRTKLVGLGASQVLGSIAVIVLVAWALGVDPRAALVAAMALSLSSTALALQPLSERGALGTQGGQATFAILLFQDLAVIPMLAVIPLLAAGPAVAHAVNPWLAGLKALAVIAAVVVGGRMVLKPVFDVVARADIQEIFTAAALLVVISVSLLMSAVGLSMSLGAFLAGVLLADSEYRHELEAAIEPFKGLLLGLFFISVGMSVDLGVIAREPLTIVAAVAGLMLMKAAIVFAIAKLAGHAAESARSLAAALSQGGEFAFVLFSLAAGYRIMDAQLVDQLVVVVTLSMAATPFALAFNDAHSRKLRTPRAEEQFDNIEAGDSKVIIAGFGRVGQIVGRILYVKKIPFTALDRSPEQVESVRRFGSKVYYGDASRLDLLRAARADRAKLFVLAIDDVEASIQTAETVRRHFPQLKIYARARNRFHAYRLMDVGCELIERETYRSSLHLAEEVLTTLGVTEWDAQLTVARFQAHDQRTLARQHAVYHDETQLRQTVIDAAKELEGLFEQDREDAAQLNADQPVFSPSDIR